MNGLALLGFLVAIGMVALAAYERRAKTAEAISSLTALGEGAARYYDASADDVHPSERRFPPSSMHSVPANVASVRGQRYQSGPNDWAWSPWKELDFSIPQPQYYAYSFGSSGRGAQARATATAEGDLDGDGQGSMFVLTVAPDATLRAAIAPDIQKTSPEE